MKREMNIWVVGGDMRQAKLAKLLAEDGHTVHLYALESAREEHSSLVREESMQRAGRADCVILPLPVTSGIGVLNAPLSPLEHPIIPIMDRLKPGQFLCGGRPGPDVLSLAKERGLILWDYFAREELAVANAVPGALAV